MASGTLVLEGPGDTRVAAEDLLPLVARNLSFSAAGNRLIDAIDLTIQSGMVTAIMGPNGAGKSLLLRLLHGIIEPATGEVRWGGRLLDETVRRRQAMVFQRPVLLRRSVSANVDFAIKLRGKRSPGQCQDLLRHVGLVAQSRQPARLLSGGEQQRLALARAIALEPDVIFLDEPAANLDPASTASIESIILAAHQRGVKIVLVTHDLGQARRLADEIVFLHRGRLVEQTRASAFFENPSSSAARDYLAGRLVF